MASEVHISPNSVHTVGVLAVTLGLGGSSLGNLDVYVDQLLCAGAVLRACCLAPVHARSSVAPGRSLVGLEGLWMSLQGCLEVPPEPWSPSSRVLPPGFLL